MQNKVVYALILGLVLTMAGCASGTRSFEVADKPISDNLYEVINARVDVAYLDPTVDFSRYNKVMVMPLDFSRMKIVQPSNSGSSTRDTKFELTDEEKEKIDKGFQETMVNQLQKRGSFTVVGAPGNDVLRLSVAMLQIAPNAPKDDPSSRGIGRSRIYTEGAGSMTIGAVIGESVTGKAVALIRDTKTSSGVWGINNRFTNYSDVLNTFSSWGAQLNRSLVDLQNNNPGGAANE